MCIFIRRNCFKLFLIMILVVTFIKLVSIDVNEDYTEIGNMNYTKIKTLSKRIILFHVSNQIIYRRSFMMIIMIYRWNISSQLRKF